MLGVMDGPAAPGKQSLGTSLDESVAVSEVTSSRAGEMLTQPASALGVLHGSFFPGEELPSSFAELVELFKPEGSAVADFCREQMVSGAQTTFLMLLAHGVEADFDKATTKFPRGSDGKTVGLGTWMEAAKKYAQQLVTTVEDRAARVQAKKASSKKSTT